MTKRLRTLVLQLDSKYGTWKREQMTAKILKEEVDELITNILPLWNTEDTEEVSFDGKTYRLAQFERPAVSYKNVVEALLEAKPELLTTVDELIANNTTVYDNVRYTPPAN